MTNYESLLEEAYRELEDLPPMSEDRTQEYLTLRLEGHGPADARRKSYAVDERGPRLNGDLRPLQGLPHEWGEGDGPVVESFTMDHRSDEEREASWAKADLVDAVLDLCTDHQRTVLLLVSGITTGEPMSQAAAARFLGIAPQSVDKAMALIRKKVGA